VQGDQLICVILYRECQRCLADGPDGNVTSCCHCTVWVHDCTGVYNKFMDMIGDCTFRSTGGTS